MQPIRRTLIAGLWGVPGPILAALAVAAVFEVFQYQWQRGLEAVVGSLSNNIAYYACIIIGEAVLGFGFGAVRSCDPPSSLRQGVQGGAVIWAAAGVPIILVGLRLVELFPLAIFEVLVPTVAIYLAHVVGGAIAGFHVEFYLLHAGGNV